MKSFIEFKIIPYIVYTNCEYIWGLADRLVFVMSTLVGLFYDNINLTIMVSYKTLKKLYSFL